MPRVMNTTMAISTSVAPRSFRTTIKPRIRHSLSPLTGGPVARVILPDQSNALDQRASGAAGRIAAGHETEEMSGHRLFTCAMPRAGALVDEHLGQVVELYPVTAWT